MQTFTLVFISEAARTTFCTWYVRCFADAQLRKSADARSVHVTVPRQFVRTVMTVARHNHAAIVEAA